MRKESVIDDHLYNMETYSFIKEDLLSRSSFVDITEGDAGKNSGTSTGSNCRKRNTPVPGPL